MPAETPAPLPPRQLSDRETLMALIAAGHVGGAAPQIDGALADAIIAAGYRRAAPRVERDGTWPDGVHRAFDALLKSIADVLPNDHSADVKGFMGLASGGPTAKCRIGQPADITLRNITAVLEVSPEAVAKWEGAPWS